MTTSSGVYVASRNLPRCITALGAAEIAQLHSKVHIDQNIGLGDLSDSSYRVVMQHEETVKERRKTSDIYHENWMNLKLNWKCPQEIWALGGVHAEQPLQWPVGLRIQTGCPDTLNVTVHHWWIAGVKVVQPLASKSWDPFFQTLQFWIGSGKLFPHIPKKSEKNTTKKVEIWSKKVLTKKPRPEAHQRSTSWANLQWALVGGQPLPGGGSFFHFG